MNKPATITEAPFDPENPQHIMVDQFFRQVLTAWQDASKTTLFRDMTPDQKLTAYINGSLTAIVTMVLLSAKPGGSEALVDVVRQAVDVARSNAEMQIERLNLRA